MKILDEMAIDKIAFAEKNFVVVKAIKAIYYGYVHALLFQAPCQIELEEWINSIHSACAAAFARHRGKTGTLHLLQEEIYRLEKGIESVSTVSFCKDTHIVEIF